MEPHPNNPKPVQSFLKRWAVTTLAVVAADILCAGIEIKDLIGVIIAPLVLGLLNAFMRPLLLLLSLPLLILTLGIFLWVINALLLLFTSHLAGDQHFQVDGFWWAMAGAAIISLVSIMPNAFLGGGRSTFVFKRPQHQSPRSRVDHDDDDGPVIDV